MNQILPKIKLFLATLILTPAIALAQFSEAPISDLPVTIQYKPTKNVFRTLKFETTNSRNTLKKLSTDGDDQFSLSHRNVKYNSLQVSVLSKDEKGGCRISVYIPIDKDNKAGPPEYSIKPILDSSYVTCASSVQDGTIVFTATKIK